MKKIKGIKNAVENVRNESVVRMEMDAYAKVERVMFYVAEIRGIAKVINDKEIINECNYISDISYVLLICIKAYYEMHGTPNENDGRFNDVQNYSTALYVSLENIINSANLGYENILDDIMDDIADDITENAVIKCRKLYQTTVELLPTIKLEAYRNILCLSTEAKDIVSSITVCEW